MSTTGTDINLRVLVDQITQPSIPSDTPVTGTGNALWFFFATSDAKTLSLIKFLFAVFLALRLHTSFYFKMYNMDTLPLTESQQKICPVKAFPAYEADQFG